ncbi:hypothetical protein BHM03_00011860, partial [Ensete ventricosum]
INYDREITTIRGLARVKSKHRAGSDDVVGNSPGVRRELVEGIGSLSGWRKGVRRKKTKTHWKIVGGSRKACRDYREDRYKHAGRSSEKDRETRHRKCQRLPDCWSEVVNLVVEPPRTAGKSPVPRRRMLVCLKEEDLGVDVSRLMSNHYKTTEKLLDRFGVPKHSAPVDFAVPPPRQRNLVV